jgi:hypothetical protein
MFVIVHNNSVILGPMRWNRYRFENTIAEECEVQATLPDRNDSQTPITVSESVQILPVQTSPTPEYNPKIEILHGPFWEFTEAAAIASYQVLPMSIDAVKSSLKAEAAAARWRKEIGTVSITINDSEYAFSTDRDTRYVLQNALLSSINAFNWKIDGNTWVVLNNAEIQSAIDAITSHVQSCFDWEAAKVAEIDSAETLEQLDEIVITEIVGVN